ncbi:M15 family metallopeptidase [Neglectibacter timonensis]|uniref:M15 family metallopeptidase n=2 Tax=Neglectibacter timonensis TaxID=1776382 RepID=A0ABT1RVF7_9FIRM|nr:M15 family metallopeptidase [Neglectibacter timonensis]MCQ4838659.1 M15 family metallopeptidase [Neglectibacter timonensis]MCQ4842092.1 M15 family metallopeptidase [Neglectibacter timonensis]
MYKKKKKNYLKNTDRRIDIGPAGRNLFISKDKQMQDRSARRIHGVMRAVSVLGILVVVTGLGLFIFGYLIPYFHSEFSVGEEEPGVSENSMSSGWESSIPLYNSMGLPVYEDEISLFVINSEKPVGADYIPDTVKVNEVQVQEKIADAVRLLVSAAKSDGLALNFSKGYVSYENQAVLFDKKVEELQKEQGLTVVMARSEAQQFVPMAGQCDDQSGMCVTVSGDPETFPDSQTYSWLKNNMGKYGFVFRYPADKEDATGHIADYTVLRYVGSVHAEAMQQRSMCLEEYISYLNSQ